MTDTQTPFDRLSESEQCAILEVVLFASDVALNERQLYRLLVELDETALDNQAETPENASASVAASEQDAETESEAAQEEKRRDAERKAKVREHRELMYGVFRERIDTINTQLADTGRVFRIRTVAGGYQFATVPELGEYVGRLLKSRSRRKLSRASLEVLAIVAYKQPITKPEIEDIRGVNSSVVVNKLMEKDLITMVGRSESIGKPLLYGTTDEFMRAFGIQSLADLPKPRELRELVQENADELAEEETILVATGSEADEIESRLRDLIHGNDEQPSENTDTEESQ